MKVILRRHGIVIRTIDVLKSPARIGSGEECEIRIDDPYLAGHVGDLVERDGEWFMVDAAASLEGITRDGRRIDDEPVAWKEPYSVGGFEVVADDGIQRAPTLSGAPTVAGNVPRPATVPGTVIEQLPARPTTIPGTVVEDISAARAAVMNEMKNKAATPAPSAPPGGRPAVIPPVMLQPQAPSQQPAPMQQPAPAKSKRLLLVIAALGAVLVLLLLVAVASRMGSAKPKPAAPVAVAPVAAPVAAPARPVEQTDDALAASLNADALLDRWEKKLSATPDAELQRRFAETAVDIGLAHLAAHDNAGAKAYFERAAKVGDPASAAVRTAKSRLAG